jgi:protein AbiQ
MILVCIEQAYTDYLRQSDYRVPKNIDITYVRPFCGVLFNVGSQEYFAPLTSTRKGKKLALSPKKESITFYPIDYCKLGGINLNNMIPVIDGVYHLINIELISDPKRKTLLQNQVNWLRKNRKYIIKKAGKLYGLKIANMLYPNYDSVTCDFKLLEKMASLYTV